MRKLSMLFFALFILAGFNNTSYAQSDDIMYFCEYYGSEGEVNCSDRFTTGKLTVMVRLAYPIYYSDVEVQMDKYNCQTGKYEYFNHVEFTVDPDWDYIHFDDVSFTQTGIYRVFLLAPDGSTITSALIEIIS